MKKCWLQHLLLALLSVGVIPAGAQESNEGGNAASGQRMTPIQAAAVADTDVPASNGSTALVRIEHFQVKGNTLLDAGLIERLLEPFKGENRSYTDIQLALEALEGAYRSAGYSAVHVVTPEQEITEGTVTFQVMETVVGKVILKGNQHYDKNNIRNALPALAEGYTPSARELSENIRLANENPTRQIDVVLALGEEENTVDAQVNVQDSSPRKFFVTLDNTGAQSTGMYRTGVGFQHNNLFNRDHAATFNYVTSPGHVKEVTQLSASYRFPLYALGDSIDLIAARSDTNTGTTSTISGPLAITGKGNVYGIHYNHYLPRKGDYASKMVAGLDYRAYFNNCVFNGIVIRQSGCNDLTVHPLSLSYGGTLTKPTYIADYTASIMRNLPGGARGGSADFRTSRSNPADTEGAPADYTLLRFNGSLAGALPRDWQYRAAGNLQYTRDALVSQESFGLVGANAVRGFTEREVSNVGGSVDKGYVVNLELYAPEMAPALKMENGSVRLLGFIDRASGWNVPLAGESVSRASVGSAGVGVRLTYGKNISAKLDVAQVAVISGNSSSTVKTGDRRGHLSVMANW